MLSVPARAARLDTLEIFSAAMRKTVSCLVVVPENYRPDGDPLPVLYLLHGWSGHFASWLGEAPQLRRHADTYRMLIVCPDGGYGSWYLDSPVDSTVRYSTHIAREVVDHVDYYYNTRRDRGGRAIAGLSMGGYGALRIAAHYPERFGAAGSMAGGLDFRPFRQNGWELKNVLGDPATCWSNWESCSAVNMADRLKAAGTRLIIDCGLGDFFLETNRQMHQNLLKTGLEHEYIERPGEHNGEYWGNAVDYQVLFFSKFFGGQ
jgi:S-formylglutathione hydrolase FrmB